MQEAPKVSIHDENEEGRIWWDRKLSSCIETTHLGEVRRENIREDKGKTGGTHKREEKKN